MKTLLKVLVGLLLTGGLFMFAFYRTPQERAFTKNLKLAQAGNMDAALTLAEAYMKGKGTKTDTQEALKWYRWASAADKPQASWELYKFYEKQGVLDRELDEESEEPEVRYQKEDPMMFDENPLEERWARRPPSQTQQQRQPQRSQQRGKKTNTPSASFQLPPQTVKTISKEQQVQDDSPRNTKEKRELALAYLQRAAQADFALAQEEMGDLYARGRAVPQHAGQSLFWYIKASKNGSSAAQEKVDMIKTKDPTLSADMEHFLQAYELAQKEDQSALIETAQAYRQGRPILQDQTKALELYQKAWDKSNHQLSQAAFELSDMYYKGEGTETNEQKGAEFLAAAAELKNPQAQYLLGEYAYTDDPARMEDAFAWFSNAAAQGHVKAQYMTGFMLFQGQGTPKSVPLAIRFFEQAAQQNDPSAQYVLGQIYLKGLGVRRNQNQGRTWLERAVENGSEPAKELLGM